MKNQRVYELLPNSREFHDFALSDSVNRAVFAKFDGRSLSAGWKALEITAADEDDELAHLGDYALLGTIPVFSSAAILTLRSILEESGELLPLKYSRGDFFAFNVTHFVDAFDESASSVTRVSTGRIISVERFEFRSNLITPETIFKVPQLPRAFLFVTDTFVDAVRTANLKGFRFRTVWPTDTA